MELVQINTMQKPSMEKRVSHYFNEGQGQY